MSFYVDPEKCNRDGFCVEACGRRLIEMGEADSVPTLTADAEELCINCGHCVAVCPSGALALQTIRPEDCPAIKKELLINLDQAVQFLRSRRSIRNYGDKSVERDKINKLIQVSGYAPSASNARPVHFLVIENKAEIRRLAGLVVDWIRMMIKENQNSPNVFHFNRVVTLWDEGKDPICRNAPCLMIAHAIESSQLARVDCILALAYAELIAPVLGLGTTWAGYMMNATISHRPLVEALKLPEGHKCFGIMMVGYPELKFVRMPLRNPPAVAWR
ncbi:MAG: 4Fe-4S dicluster domain-containing protein [Deltaproteobacteria bacterium]|nr:4Fe-4S dicluster domain-containing protein [Deltaproteobacteria bacterium]